MSTQASTFPHFLTRDDLEKISAQFFLEVKGWRWAVGRDWHQIQFPVTQTCQPSQRPNLLVVTSLRTITLAFCSHLLGPTSAPKPPGLLLPVPPLTPTVSDQRGGGAAILSFRLPQHPGSASVVLMVPLEDVGQDSKAAVTLHVQDILLLSVGWRSS